MPVCFPQHRSWCTKHHTTGSITRVVWSTALHLPTALRTPSLPTHSRLHAYQKPLVHTCATLTCCQQGGAAPNLARAWRPPCCGGTRAHRWTPPSRPSWCAGGTLASKTCSYCQLVASKAGRPLSPCWPLASCKRPRDAAACGGPPMQSVAGSAVCTEGTAPHSPATLHILGSCIQRVCCVCGSVGHAAPSGTAGGSLGHGRWCLCFTSRPATTSCLGSCTCTCCSRATTGTRGGAAAMCPCSGSGRYWRSASCGC